MFGRNPIVHRDALTCLHYIPPLRRLNLEMLEQWRVSLQILLGNRMDYRVNAERPRHTNPQQAPRMPSYSRISPPVLPRILDSNNMQQKIVPEAVR